VSYDPNNVFARILRGEIPAKKVHENAHALAFHDISPQAPVHVLVIPKGAYVQMDEFTRNASEAELAGFLRAVGEVARLTGVDKTGYRLIVNNGRDGRQDVPHLHLHVLGGAPLGRMLPRD
jgi:histidine triad (HIT) family protein